MGPDAWNFVVDEAAVPLGELVAVPRRELITAWDSWWCETCSARTWVAGTRCHGAPMTAVRIEMYEREPRE